MADLEDDCGRGFFRVDDELRLSWIKVEPDSITPLTDRNMELHNLNAHLHTLISTAFGNSAVVGEALGLLNRKIELLSGEEDVASISKRFRQMSVVQAWPLHRMNLSGPTTLWS